MHRDWKRVQQWVFLSVLFLAAAAEVAENVMVHARRLQEAGLATRAMGEGFIAHLGWCRK